MEDLLHTAKSDLALVAPRKQHLVKLRRLALKRKYREFQDQALEIQLLVGLFERQAARAEEKTCQAVENCQRLISAGVEEFFNHREAQIILFVRDLLKGQPLDSELFSRLVSVRDLKEIAFMSRDILSAELTSRFGTSHVKPIIRVDLEDLQAFFELINEWKTNKQRTVMISELVDRLSNKAWGRAVNSVLDNRVMAEDAGNVNIGRVLLKALAVDLEEEKDLLFDGMVRRVQGVMKILQERITRDMYLRAAEILYCAHDRIVGTRLEDRIATLQDKLTNLAELRTERA